MMQWSGDGILWDVFKARPSWSLCIIPLIHSGTLRMWESFGSMNTLNHLQAVLNSTDQKEKKTQNGNKLNISTEY